jgi:acid phosphatase (class A)
MKIPSRLVLIFLAASALTLAAQQPATTAAQKPAARQSYYINPEILESGIVIAPPPSANSDAGKADLAEIHQVEATRTPAQVRSAQSDEKGENIFLFHNVMGEKFSPETLPLVAELGKHVNGDGGILSSYLKKVFLRPRPYQADLTLHPVCHTNSAPNSYPSGHTISAYLLALTLIEMVPEKQQEILARAEEFAHNRMVCGVHYRSDLVAGRNVAYAVFGYMLATPKFQSDLSAAKAELRKQLGLK